MDSASKPSVLYHLREARKFADGLANRLASAYETH
jgi:hypothetical protein